MNSSGNTSTKLSPTDLAACKCCQINSILRMLVDVCEREGQELCHVTDAIEVAADLAKDAINLIADDDGSHLYAVGN